MILYPFAPGLYFIKTRLDGLAQKISWIIVYFIPIFLFYIWNISQDSLSTFIALCSATILVNLVYENGYIQNDVWTARRELKPTKRLSESDNLFIYQNLYIISLVRLFFLIIFFNILSKNISFKTLMTFTVGLLLLQGIFHIYNSLRSKINLYLIIPLSYLRFYLPLLVFIPIKNHYHLFIYLFLLYPIPKFLEFCKQPRYEMKLISKLVGNIDFFRVIYYFFLTILFSLFYFIEVPDFRFLLLLSIFYFSYRLIGYLLIKKSARFSNAILKGAKEEYRK